MNRVCILGATGSIGLSTLDVIGRNPEQFELWSLVAHSRVDQLFELCVAYSPRYAVLVDVAAAQALAERLLPVKPEIVVLAGAKAAEEMAAMDEVDIVVAAIVGAAGLLPTLAAAKAGKRILLANKEALVMSGQLFMQTVKQNDALLLPIDSEHNALFQCLPADYQGDVQAAGLRRLILTASGGPFRGLKASQLQQITPEQACRHPNWTMGRKISIDSATLMNKALEVIEAHWLFNVAPSQIDVVVHPQSIIHSLVEYQDGSMLAQLGSPDMRTPIANALAWPKRINSGVAFLDLLQIARLDFEQPDDATFPCLQLAYQCLQCGDSASTLFNAANEIAVNAFLTSQIGFLRIADVIAEVLFEAELHPVNDLDAVLMADQLGRRLALAACRRLAES
jgi:1-deoxy-D-xylulose-5-phosphate reductoisomerase